MAFGKGGSKEAARDLGLLVLRLGLGFNLLILHGWPKLTGGTQLWSAIGGDMQHFGIRFAPVFWGFMAALAESAGSILLILGVLFRPAAAILAINMLVAVSHHLHLAAGAPNSGWNGASFAASLLAVYLGLLLTGPGRFSLGPNWKRG